MDPVREVLIELANCETFSKWLKNEKGIDMTYEEVYDNISKRDYNDMHKEVGSLTRTDDQIYIDTTNITVDEEVEIIGNIVFNKK